jgi:hypothetical protein
MKTSLPHDSFTGETKYKGKTLWNCFEASKTELINVCIPNYTLMSGETLDNYEMAVSRMLPYIWLIGKSKSLAAQRNRAKKSKKEEDTDDDKAWPDAHLNDFLKLHSPPSSY